MEKAMHCCC